MESRHLIKKSNYKLYLQSPHWDTVKKNYKKYFNECISCGSKKIELHHRSYVRLGEERLLDLLPLCRECHYKVHKYSKENNIPIQATHKILRKLNQWTRKYTREKFRSFSLSKKGFRWLGNGLKNKKNYIFASS